MGKYFGTDGIRGVVNKDLDANLAFKVGQAAAVVLADNKEGKPLVTIGKDTRISCDMLESALIAGLCSAGADVMTLDVVPTPAVAYITKNSKADAGIVISASHNPFEHNGIKIFNADGFKLPDELENEIEALVDNPETIVQKTNGDIGRIMRRHHQIDNYVEHVFSSAECPVGRFKVIIDCSNGAASRTATDIFSRFPIELELIKSNPDGMNINDKCGSTHIALLGRMVVAGGYDLGIAFDGDADRCIIVDELGNEVDGDKIMAICGAHMKEKGKLKKNTIVATVMSNMGFHDFAAQHDISLTCTAVGDRNVLEKMQECGYNLGGEQSGHIIFLDDCTTGDGQLAAVKFLSVLTESGKKVSELVAEIPRYPQLLENIPIEGGNPVKEALMASENLVKVVEDEEKKLAGKGRILVRPSGTEALIRIMVEAENENTAINCMEFLTKFIKNLVKSIDA